MIRYQIFQTGLRSKTRYYARVNLKDNLGRQDLVKRMKDAGTSLTEVDIDAVLDLFQSTVERLCTEGNAVNWEGFVRFTPVIGGEFQSHTDHFQAKKHSLAVRAAVSRAFNKRFAVGGSVERDPSSLPGPTITAVEDLATSTRDSQVTVGDIVTVVGSRLKFDPQDPRDHLRFINADDVAQVVDVTRLFTLVNSRLVFVMPAVGFARGYFEICNCLGTSIPRMCTSETVDVISR